MITLCFFFGVLVNVLVEVLTIVGCFAKRGDGLTVLVEALETAAFGGATLGMLFLAEPWLRLLD